LKQAHLAVSGDAVGAAAAVELLHEASLIHDDVCDGSATRRNRPSVVALFGVRQAGAAGVYLAGHALGLLAAIRRRRRLDVDAGVVRRLAEGQLLEMLGEAHSLDRLRAHYRRVV